MTGRTSLTVILAAGEGTRMRSALPKVEHRIAGRSMLEHVIAAAADLGGNRQAVVIGPEMQSVRDLVHRADPTIEVFVQRQRRGTAHAVLAARPALERGTDDVLVLFGDTPLVRSSTLQRLRQALAEGAGIVVLGFRARDPAGYGRLLVRDGVLEAIREDRDASDAERTIDFVNGGVMALAGRLLPQLLDEVENRNAKGEYYLTDAVAIARRRGLRVMALETEECELLGVNSRAQLAAAEAEIQEQLRARALEGGATLVAPETVFLSFDTILSRDVVLEPHVVCGPGVRIGEGAVIHAFSHLEGADVAPGASIGPFARLRPGAHIGEKARIGNFVEVKAARVEVGAKINHLSYVGDARIGAGANIGAGTITCNYDGYQKHTTEIGAKAFIGSNSSLVAPVSVGAGAYVGSGSVITEDVPPNALAVGRGRQVVKPGWADTFRARMAALIGRSSGHT